MKYIVAHGRDLHSPYRIQAYKEYLKYADSIEEANTLRELSGDLVFNEDGTICESQDWLFQWEKESNTAYAQQCIKHKVTLVLHHNEKL